MTDPEILFLPFAVPEPLGDLRVGGRELDEAVLARRLPDLLHVLLNDLHHGGRGAAIGMLEIQSPPDDGAPRWVTLVEPPDPADVLEMLGARGRVRTLVTGSLRRCDPEHLAIDLLAHAAAVQPGDDADGGPLEARDGDAARGGDDALDGAAAFDGDGEEADVVPRAGPRDGAVPRGIRGLVRLDDPVRGLLRLGEHLAVVLGLGDRRLDGSPALGTSALAFFRLLDGLDGAALLGGDAELEPERHGIELLEPLAEALELDPAAGLALRTLATAMFVALDGERIGETACLQVVDRALGARPADGDACVGLAEQLTLIGDRDRAAAWLEHAVSLVPPAPRALESLGVLVANRGDTERARALWTRGAELDGSPDFSAHLARLAFGERRIDDAWRCALDGLRRTWERATRTAEWPAVAGDAPSVLLRYLSEHLDRGDWPDELEVWLTALVGALREPQSRVDLGVCLAKIGQPDRALGELQQGLAADVGPSVTDRGVRALLALQIPGFEKRFALATERAVRGRDPRGALVELQAYLEHRPDFWPALFYVGVALKRLGHTDDALDVMAEVLDRRPGQVDALTEMADMFAARGNPKRALECVDEALVLHPELADLHLKRARFLEQLGRVTDATRALDRAVDLDSARELDGRN
ncbi:MAG: tetratricopeptide repeat protein [Planctomycetes bacterium]|nr:tetratricopeptide repeat protein [Planctomycetota bacterium]